MVYIRTTNYKVHIKQDTFNSTQYSVHSKQYKVHSTQHLVTITVHSELITQHKVLRFQLYVHIKQCKPQLSMSHFVSQLVKK